MPAHGHRPTCETSRPSCTERNKSNIKESTIASTTNAKPSEQAQDPSCRNRKAERSCAGHTKKKRKTCKQIEGKQYNGAAGSGANYEEVRDARE
jgi:hypothetical protein